MGGQGRRVEELVIADDPGPVEALLLPDKLAMHNAHQFELDIRPPATTDTCVTPILGTGVPFRRDRVLRVPDLNLWCTEGRPNWASDASWVRWSITYCGPWRLLSFSLRTPQRNRNELGETTVNKTGQKRLAQREKSTT
jgi:hypothetical protein